MPANTHLEWFEVREFGGLWTNADRSMMPANAAQVMSGCHPQPGGGLRAFYKASAENTTSEFLMDGHSYSAGTRPLVVGANAFVWGTTSQDNTPSLSLITTSAPYALRVAPDPAHPTTPEIGHPGSDAVPERYVVPKNPAPASMNWLSVQAKIDPGTWAPAAHGIIAAHAVGGTVADQGGWALELRNDGSLCLYWREVGVTGINSATSPSPVGLTDGVPGWVRADYTWSGGNYTVAFYTSPDGFTWTAINPPAAGSGPPMAGAPAGTPVTIGHQFTDYSSGPPYTKMGPLGGDIYFVEFRSAETGGGPTYLTRLDFTHDLGDANGTGTPLSERPAPPEPATFVGSPEVTKAEALSGPDEWHFHFWDTSDTTRRAWRTLSTAFSHAVSTTRTPWPMQPTFTVMWDRASALGPLYLAMATGDPAKNNGLYLVVPYDLVLDPGLPPLGPGVHFRANNPPIDPAEGIQFVTTHQARLVTGYRDMVRFSAPGSDSFSAAGSGFIRVNPAGWSTLGDRRHDGAVVAWILPVPPGDLIVATRDGSVYNVQGDLGDPTVRELGRWNGMLAHEPALTTHGPVLILPHQGVSIMNLDGQVESLSTSLNPSIWGSEWPHTGLGRLDATERYLWAPNPHRSDDTRITNGALVYDFDTRAWFTSSHPDEVQIDRPRFMHGDPRPRDPGMWVIGRPSWDETVPFVYRYGLASNDGRPSDSMREDRASVWEWQSAPFREPGGRRLIIREVQIPAHAFNETSTLTVTVGNTTRVVNLTAGRNVCRILFQEQAETLDITVKAESHDDAVEAPMIDAVRAGWRSGALL